MVGSLCERGLPSQGRGMVLDRADVLAGDDGDAKKVATEPTGDRGPVLEGVSKRECSPKNPIAWVVRDLP